MLVLLALSAHPAARASTFRLQSNTVILDERDGRVAFNIDNTGSEPILLLSRLDDLDDSAMASRILVTPAVTRIDPGQSQVVNFILKKGVQLEQEHLLKASFEGVAQQTDRGMRMPIRQQIGFILQPRSLAPVPEPARTLRFAAADNTLTVTNSGKHVVRLGPTLTVQPSGATGTLPHPYLHAGESLNVQFETLGQVEYVEIVPLSRYGFANKKITLPLTP